MRENGLMLTSEVLTKEVERTLIAKGNSTKKSQPIQVRRMADVFSEWIAGQYESGVFGMGRRRHYDTWPFPQDDTNE